MTAAIAAVALAVALIVTFAAGPCTEPRGVAFARVMPSTINR